MIFPVYVLGKYLAYSIWCYLGLRWLRDKKSAGAGMAFGSVRLGLGIIFGVAIFVIGGMLHLNAPANSWFAYFAVYVPVRYVEWSILAASARNAGRANLSDHRRGDAALDSRRHHRFAPRRSPTDSVRRRRTESVPARRALSLLANPRNVLSEKLNERSHPPGLIAVVLPFSFASFNPLPRLISPIAVSFSP